MVVENTLVLFAKVSACPTRQVSTVLRLGFLFFCIAAFSYFLQAAAQEAAPIYQSQAYTLWPERVQDGRFVARALSTTEIVSNVSPSGRVADERLDWKLADDIAAFPQVQSPYSLLDAVYNLSLSELIKDKRPDGTLSAGAQWEGVWTRDVSYSILLSLAAVAPDAAKLSLMRKVSRDRIVQDTGTGGSWPVSSDRVCWALAAWEIYLTTGDRDWLQRSSKIVANSMEDDQHAVIDTASGLAHGESSFLDWREQTYPRWMQPADIYASEDLSTNVLYYRAYRILSMMAVELGQPHDVWDLRADRIRKAINDRFWNAERHSYGQYLYGREWQTLSTRSEALGDALAILFDVADPKQQIEVLRSQPFMPYGVPAVYPQAPDIQPYHNRSVWPFVQAFWNLAAAKDGDEDALLYGIACLTRSSALFLTNKENFVVDTGSSVGTAINSDRQLWSVAGNLATTYRVLFGLTFTTDGLSFHPFVPTALAGVRTLSNFHYRRAVLDIIVEGSGRAIDEFTLDGQRSSATIPAGLVGEHVVRIKLKPAPSGTRSFHLSDDATALATPSVKSSDNSQLTWDAVAGASSYQIYRNGKAILTTSERVFKLPAVSRTSATYQVAATGSQPGSFLSEPIPLGRRIILAAIHGSLTSAVELQQTGTTGMTISGPVPESGRYFLTFLYANGSGPVNTDNKCGVRTLFIDGKKVGVIVLPQRGEDKWNDWGTSSSQTVKLGKGEHTFELRLTPSDRNMNGAVNRVLISSITLERLE